MEQKIEIRDEEGGNFFMVKNIIMTEYFPLLGATGLAMYMLYKSMANRTAGDTLYPSMSLISKHMGMSESTISTYNWLLEQCDLLSIKTGNARASNLYTLLPVAPVTPALLRRLADALKPAATDGQRWASFKANRLEAVQGWQPLRAHFKPKLQAPLPLAANGNGNGSAPPPPAAEPLVALLVARFESNKPRLTEKGARSMVEQYGEEAVKQQLAWLAEREIQENPLKTLRAALKGDWPPPSPPPTAASSSDLSAAQLEALLR